MPITSMYIVLNVTPLTLKVKQSGEVFTHLIVPELPVAVAALQRLFLLLVGVRVLLVGAEMTGLRESLATKVTDVRTLSRVRSV